MSRRAAIAVGLAFAVLLAAVIWLWRDRAAVIRERDFVVWRYVNGCNSINLMYGDIEGVGAAFQEAAAPERVRVMDQQEAERFAARLISYGAWLQDCSMDERRVDALNDDLSKALRLGRGKEVQTIAGELRKLVPYRAHGDRSWIRLREIP